MNRIDESQIYKWYDLMKGNSQLVEIRIIGENKIYSGYFTNAENIVNAIKPYTNYGIYFTINSINDACYDREQKDRIIQKPKNTTTDAEIVGRDFVFLDLDSKRATGVNATDEELEYTKNKTNQIYKFLTENGFYKPIVLLSGNGTHIYLPCALKNTEENTNIVKRFTMAMSMLFSDERVDIDEKVFNAGRISKIAGTYSNKGSRNSENRPQRMCEFVSVPTEIKVNDLEYFKKIADLYPEEEVKPTKANNYNVEKFDLDSFISKHGIKVTRVENVAGGKKYLLDHCVFNEQHRGKDAVIFQKDNGGLSYVCLHNSCSNKKWEDFRMKFEPNAYDKKSYDYKPRFNRDEPKQFIPQQHDKEKGEVWVKLGDVEKPKLTKSDFIPSGITELDRKGLGLMRKHVTVLSGLRSCVDCDTEYFNGTRWVKISEYNGTDKVLQYNADGTASLVKPNGYIKEKADSLWLMKTQQGVNQCVCDNHRIIYESSKGNLCEKTMKELIAMHDKSAHGFSGKFYTSFDYGGEGIDLTDDEIRVMCAVICDGTFRNSFKDKNICRINIKKQRKKDRLEMLLDKAGIEYRKKQYNPKDPEFNSYIFHAPRADKKFGEYWYRCNKSQLHLICEEFIHWDGTVRGKERMYCSNVKETADFIQYAFACNGVRAAIYTDNRIGREHISSNKVYIRKSIDYTVRPSICTKVGIVNTNKKNEITKYETKDGYKYCFTVPSGMLVLRRENVINITGNCGKTSFLNMVILNAIQTQYNVGLWSGEMDAGELKQWMYLQAAGKNHVIKRGESEFYETKPSTDSKISVWLDKHLSVYNNRYSMDSKQLIDSIRKRHEVEKFDLVCLDNLMMMGDESLNGTLNEKDKQKLIMLTSLAKELDIHIILVAHPNKSSGLLRIEKISGAGDISNLAQNVFLFHRVRYNENEIVRDLERDVEEFFGAGAFARFSPYSNVLEVAKFRAKGTLMGSTYGMFYEKESGRFKNSVSEHIVYGWQDEQEQKTIYEYVEPTHVTSYIDTLPPVLEESPF